MTTASPNLIMLVGAGGHARACIDVIEREGRFSIAGLIGTPDEVGSSVLGYPVVGSDQDLEEWLRRHPRGLVTVGQIKTSQIRVRLFEQLERYGRSVPAIVSPRAYVSAHASVGEGSIVLHGAVINAGAKVGRNCIVNSMALIEHDVTIGDHCHIATGAKINGGVHVGESVFLGSGCIIREGVRIHPGGIVGMGALIVSDCSGLERAANRGVVP